MSSDTKINFSLRPAKSIERKMLLEIFREVCPPKKVDEFQYIGFGSSFFTDFKLLHRSLNLSKMINIEINETSNNQKRIKFNKPYKCIELKFGSSNTVLPKLNWSKKSIVWLDYDKALQSYMLEDIETCCHNFKSGSILIISLRREFDQKKIRDFKETFPIDSPSKLRKVDLEPKNNYKTIRKMIINKIQY